MVQAEVRRTEEDQRKARSTELGKKWELPERELTWVELWRKDQFSISVLLRSAYDTLPSPVESSLRPKLQAVWQERDNG